MTLDVFSGIYQRNAWNGVESKSGPGSGAVATIHVAADILALVDELGITTVLDAACGDGYWMPDLPGYVGVDIASEAIDQARLNHPSRVYVVGNIVEMDLPPVDLIVFRDALQHLPQDVGLAAIASLRASGSRYLLASTYRGGVNIDILAGDCYDPDLEAEPFWMGPPERVIFDGYGYAATDAVRDPRKHLGLWRL